MTEAAHSPYGPSSAERWMNCPASIRAQKGLPDKDTPFAILGTAAHTLSEWARKYNKPAEHWLGHNVLVKLVGGGSQDVPVDRAMVDGVQEFLDYVNGLGGEHLVEVRVRYENQVPGGFGTLDHGTLKPGFAEITDLKFGLGVVKYAKWNPQLLLYAWGVYLEHNWLYGFEKFKLTIHQPRKDHVDSWEITTDELIEWVDKVLVPAYKRTLDPKAPFNPGTWCQFCKIDGRCKAQVKAKFEAAQGEFTNLNELSPTPVDTLTLDEMALLKTNHFPALAAWMKSVDKALFTALSSGEKAGDLKIVDGRSVRVWDALPERIEAKVAALGIKAEDLWEPPTLKTPPAIEKLTGKAKFKALAEIVKKIPGKPTIAQGDDKRPAITVDLSKEFSNLNEGDDE